MMIALDIDGVLADFVSPFLRLLERRVGGGPIDATSITDPNFQSHPFLTKEIIYDCMVDASYDPEFWRVLAPLPSQSRAFLMTRSCMTVPPSGRRGHLAPRQVTGSVVQFRRGAVTSASPS